MPFLYLIASLEGWHHDILYQGTTGLPHTTSELQGGMNRQDFGSRGCEARGQLQESHL